MTQTVCFLCGEQVGKLLTDDPDRRRAMAEHLLREHGPFPKGTTAARRYVCLCGVAYRYRDSLLTHLAYQDDMAAHVLGGVLTRVGRIGR